MADAARKYLIECRTREVRTLDLVSFHVQLLLPYIGTLPLREVCNESLEQFKLERQDDGKKNSTINRSLEVVRSTLIRAARVWREDGEPWLTVPPLIEMLDERAQKREPYPNRAHAAALRHGHGCSPGRSSQQRAAHAGPDDAAAQRQRLKGRHEREVAQKSRRKKNSSETFISKLLI